MHQKLFLLTFAIFLATHLFAQVRTVRPLAKKTVVNTSAEKPIVSQKPATTGSQPSPVLEEPKISFTSGEKGKSSNTILVIAINDGKQLKAADYSEVGLTAAVEDDRYPKHIKYVPYVPQFDAGEYELLTAKLDMSEPVGVELIGSLPYTVNRYAVLSDFANGGSIVISIAPEKVYPLIGPDTWNVNSFTATLSFDGDPASSHKMTWNGFTLSPTATSRTLKFDKNFNPVQ